MKFRLWLSLFFSLIILGCSSNQIIIPSQFNGEQARLMLSKGNNTVKGIAYVKTDIGDVISCSGFPIELIPATDYANQRIAAFTDNGRVGAISFQNHSYLSGLVKPDVKDYSELTLKTTCDESGKFEFVNVSNGDYHIKAMAAWKQRFGFVHYIGAIMYEKITLVGGEIREVDLNTAIKIISLTGEVKANPIK